MGSYQGVSMKLETASLLVTVCFTSVVVIGYLYLEYHDRLGYYYLCEWNDYVEIVADLLTKG